MDRFINNIDMSSALLVAALTISTLFNSIPVYAQQPNWDEIRKVHDTKSQNSEAMLYSEEAVKNLGLSVNCSGYKEAVTKCTSFQCVEKTDLMGQSFYIDKIVYGFNEGNQCVINSGLVRYFVPKVELKTFSEVFLSPITNSSTKSNNDVGSGASVTTEEFDQILSGTNCHVTKETTTTSDKSQKVLVTADNMAEFQNSMTMTETDGKIYAFRTSTTKAISITPVNSSICTKEKFELLDKLQAQGLIVQLPPTMIGFSQTGTDYASAQSTTQTSSTTQADESFKSSGALCGCPKDIQKLEIFSENRIKTGQQTPKCGHAIPSVNFTEDWICKNYEETYHKPDNHKDCPDQYICCTRNYTYTCQ